MSQPRGFSTAVFTVKPSEKNKDQTLFIVGLNKTKFLGQHGSEEGLKLLERVADHDPAYKLLLSISEKDLKEMEEDHRVEGRRLTAHRELEKAMNAEFVPLVQATMVDRRPRRAFGRSLRTDQNHTALALAETGEAVKMYWAFWKRKEYKDLAAYKFWSKHFPRSAEVYYGERAELIAIRTIEHLSMERERERGGTSVLAVHNDIFQLVTEKLRPMLELEPSERYDSREFAKKLRDRATKICRDVPDLTSALVFIYLGLPMLLFQQFYLACTYYFGAKVTSSVMKIEVNENRD